MVSVLAQMRAHPKKFSVWSRRGAAVRIWSCTRRPRSATVWVPLLGLPLGLTLGLGLGRGGRTELTVAVSSTSPSHSTSSPPHRQLLALLPVLQPLLLVVSVLAQLRAHPIKFSVWSRRDRRMSPPVEALPEPLLPPDWRPRRLFLLPVTGGRSLLSFFVVCGPMASSMVGRPGTSPRGLSVPWT